MGYSQVTPDASIQLNTNTLIRNSTLVTRSNHALINDELTLSKISRGESYNTTGVANSYSASIPWLTSYSSPFWVALNFSTVNTGTSTINLNLFGNISVLKNGGSGTLIPLTGFELYGMVWLYFNGINFQIVSGSGAGYSGTGYLKLSGLIPSYISSIPNSDLANPYLTIAGNSTALGGAVTQDQITGLSTTGLVKRSAANTLSIATAGTDYAAPTSGASILYGNGSGGFSNVTIGSGLSFSSGTLSSTVTSSWGSITGTLSAQTDLQNALNLKLNVASPAYTGVMTTGTLGYSDTGILASMQSSTNSFNQLILQNTNSGTTASTNYVLSNDVGTATSYYGEFGMNSSGFTGAGSFNIPSVVYLDSKSSDLTLGTLGNNSLHFVTNNSTTDALTINGSGQFTFNAASPNNSFSSNFTTTANNQYGLNIGGTATLRATANDANTFLNVNATQFASSTGQALNGVVITHNPTYSGVITNIAWIGSNTTAGCTNGTYTNQSAPIYVNSDGTGGGTGALFTVVVSGGVISSVTLTNGGSGYRLNDYFSLNGSTYGGSGSYTQVTVYDVQNNPTNTSASFIVNNKGIGSPLYQVNLFSLQLANQEYFGIRGAYGTPTYIYDYSGTFLNTSSSVLNFTRFANMAGGLGVKTLVMPTYTINAAIAIRNYLTSGANVVEVLAAANISSSFVNANQFYKGGVVTNGTIAGGSGYVNGTYTNVNLTGGVGSGAIANITVAGGAVTSVAMQYGINSWNRNGYKIGDVLTTSNTNLGGSGSGFTYTVSAIDFSNTYFAPYNVTATFLPSNGGLIYRGYYDATTINQLSGATGYAASFEDNRTITSAVNLYSFLSRPVTALGGVALGANNPLSGFEVGSSFGASIATVSANTTLDYTYYTVLVDASGGAKTITLPTASTATRRIYVVVKKDASANNVTISTTVGGNLTISSQYSGYHVQSDGTNWYKINSF